MQRFVVYTQHPPWSNLYEIMVYMAWGIVFVFLVGRVVMQQLLNSSSVQQRAGLGVGVRRWEVYAQSVQSGSGFRLVLVSSGQV